jgi:hypothetical protein
MNIRSSILPSYPDCPRRAVAKQFRRKFEKLGYTFRELPPSVGAAAGTATHTGCEQILRARHSGRDISLDEALAPAFAGFEEETGKGAIWDDTTPNANTARQQISRMVLAYQQLKITPLTVNGEPAVELSLEADCGDGWKLTGHIDVIDDHGWPRDTKTGALVRPYAAQLGGYSLLVRSNRITPVNGLCIDFIQRVGKTRHQPPCVTHVYPVAAAERRAMGIVNRIKQDMTQFDETGNVESFMANDNSMMCSDKYCPAFNSDFCELTKVRL